MNKENTTINAIHYKLTGYDEENDRHDYNKYWKVSVELFDGCGERVCLPTKQFKKEAADIIRRTVDIVPHLIFDEDTPE